MGARDALPGLHDEDFNEFFEEVNGYPPFPWQTRLLNEILAKHRWPDVLDLPTAVVWAPIAFPALFLATQVEVERTPSAFILKNVLIDPLMADADIFLIFQPVTDLYWAPFFDYEFLDTLPGLFRDAGTCLTMMSICC